jgi:hypothetical protein
MPAVASSFSFLPAGDGHETLSRPRRPNLGMGAQPAKTYTGVMTTRGKRDAP